MKILSTKYLLVAAVMIAVFLSACKKQIEDLETIAVNHPPTAHAGKDYIVTFPGGTVKLDGSASIDPDNNIATYEWRKISGASEVTLLDSNGVMAQVLNLVVGTFQFELKVTDALGLFSRDTAQVIVNVDQASCDIASRPIIPAHLVELGKVSFPKTNMFTAAANGKIIFGGGSTFFLDDTGLPIRRVDIYDVNKNSWSTHDLDEYPTWRMDMGVTATNDKIFIAGGGFWGDDIYTSQVDIYNTANDSWSTSGLSEGRTGTTGVTAGDKVFFAGGYFYNGGPNSWSNTVDIYDDATNTWTTDQLSEGRGYVSAVSAGNKVFFVAGAKSNGGVILSDRIDEYDLLTNSWSTSSLPEAMAGVATLSVGNKVFFAGGHTINHESGRVEIRDVATGGISYDCIIPRTGLTAVSTDNEIVFFTGTGSDWRNGTHFDIYNLADEKWYTGELNVSITNAAVISVNNVIYVAGGLVNNVPSDQVWTLEF